MRRLNLFLFTALPVFLLAVIPIRGYASALNCHTTKKKRPAITVLLVDKEVKSGRRNKRYCFKKQASVLFTNKLLLSICWQSEQINFYVLWNDDALLPDVHFWLPYVQENHVYAYERYYLAEMFFSQRYPI